MLARGRARDADTRGGAGALGAAADDAGRRGDSTRRAAAIRSTSSNSPGRSTARRGSRMRAPEVSSEERRSHRASPRRSRGARSGLRRTRGSSSRARRWPAIRSSRSWPRLPPGSSRGDRALTSCCDSTSSASRTSPDASASVTHSSAGRSTSRLRPAGDQRARALRRGLAAHGSSASARAHHVELSARQGDAAAVACLREAGETAAPRAPASAAHWFGEALRLLSETRRPRSASSCSWPGPARSPRPANSATATQRTRRHEDRAPEAEASRVRLTAACAAVEHLRGRYQEAHAHLETAFAGLRDPESAQGAELMIELAGDSLSRGTSTRCAPGRVAQST